MKLAALLFAAVMLTHPNATAQPSGDELTDTQKLGMALDYFTGGKYHEALMMFVKLDKSYKLNPRFKAYIGVCYFHEWEYEQACRYFDAAIPYLDAYAPAERSVYYGMAAESHFNLQEYDKAVPLYERKILVCNINERADVLYKLGFCYMFRQRWTEAADYFKSAAAYYEAHPRPGSNARLEQIGNMITGCEEHAEKQDNKPKRNNR